MPRHARHPAILAYLFDLDGTLVDTERLWTRAAARYLRRRGKPIAAAQAAALVHGRAWHDIYADIARRWPDLDIGVDRMADELRPVFLALRDTTETRIPTSIALLRTLAAHTPVAIVSGSPNRDIAEAIAHMGVADCLRFFLGSSDYTPGKPHPACFLAAARRLEVAPECCVVFEDSTAGIRAARAAGMALVALVRPGAPEPDTSSADLVLRDLADYDVDALREAVARRPAR